MTEKSQYMNPESAGREQIRLVVSVTPSYSLWAEIQPIWLAAVHFSLDNGSDLRFITAVDRTGLSRYNGQILNRDSHLQTNRINTYWTMHTEAIDLCLWHNRCTDSFIKPMQLFNVLFTRVECPSDCPCKQKSDCSSDWPNKYAN